MNKITQKETFRLIAPCGALNRRCTIAAEITVHGKCVQKGTRGAVMGDSGVSEVHGVEALVYAMEMELP